MQKWATEAVAAGVIPDLIIDSNHTIKYLQYAATHHLFTKRGGQEKDTNERLSAGSLKKINMMLGRIQHRQVDSNPVRDVPNRMKLDCT